MPRITTWKPASGPLPAISAVILAGGRSRRMGTDKAKLVFDRDDPVTMLQRVTRVVQGVSVDIVVVGGKHDVSRSSPGIRYVEDDYPGEGPLGGLLTGLRMMRHDRCLVTTCDLPFIDERLLAELVGRDVNAMVTVMAAPAAANGMLEPFPGVYHRRCRATVEALFAAGERSMQSVLRTLDTTIVPPTTVQQLDAAGWTFFNVNTPADALAAERHLRDLRANGRDLDEEAAEARPSGVSCIAEGRS